MTFVVAVVASSYTFRHRTPTMRDLDLDLSAKKGALVIFLNSIQRELRLGEFLSTKKAGRKASKGATKKGKKKSKAKRQSSLTQSSRVFEARRAKQLAHKGANNKQNRHRAVGEQE